ncbi:MAG: hypothetical protein DRO88_05790 [Promethearchaeia archaeon]|nr:MAG: hypothetical protein DRO88_05790 [Candidatus Lokiarchaeia archaeon]
MNEEQSDEKISSHTSSNSSFPPILAVTGGKGGTGKTLIATNLAVTFSKNNFKVLLVDCDVENPNSYILLGKKLDDESVESQSIDIFVPKFNKNACVKCGDCQKACYRHAILQFPDHFPSVMPHLCSGCEVCQKICSYNAIDSSYRPIGKKYYYPQTYEGLDLLVGELTPSEALSAHIVEHLIDEVQKPEIYSKYDLIIFDSAPGAHCDVEKILNASDMVISITEPTPFGEHDLNRILELLEIIDKNSYFIINRANLTKEGEDLSKRLSSYESIEYLGSVDVDKTLMEDYALGEPFSLDPRTFPAKTQFLEIFEQIQEILTEEFLKTKKSSNENLKKQKIREGDK